MKVLKTQWMCGLAMLAAACGGTMSDELPSPSPAGVEERAPEALPEPAGAPVELHLVGTQAGTLSTLLAGVRDLRVTYAGRELPAEVAQEQLDLANTQRSWLVGTFHVPAEADRVQVTLYLDDYGAFVDAESSGDFDARGMPIRFEAPVKLLAAHGRAVVNLDLTRSLMNAGEEQKVLLPQYGISY